MTAMFLVFCAYLGGCAGSTAGGNKFIRDIISIKMILREFKQMLHPNSVISLKYQGKAVDKEVRHAVMGFMTFAAGTSLILTVLLVGTGMDYWSAFTAVAACINVLGPGFGEVGSNFLSVSDTGTWILSGAMILGRLEILAILPILNLDFWRK
mgnify:FL=1